MFKYMYYLLSVYRVLEELKCKQYHSQMDRYLQLFHHRPMAAALYKKVNVSIILMSILCFSTVHVECVAVI